MASCMTKALIPVPLFFCNLPSNVVSEILSYSMDINTDDKCINLGLYEGINI